LNQNILNILSRIRPNTRITSFLLIIIAISGFAQTEKNTFFSTIYLEAKVHYGFIIPHHTEIRALTKGFFPVWEVSIVKQTDGRKPYQYYRHYPQIRLTYLHSNFGASEQLGIMNAVLPNINLPLMLRENITCSFGMGLGIAHLSKKFDRINNFQNLAIGSNYNAAVRFALSVQFKLAPLLQFNAGLSMLHISNGTIKSPNYGLNYPAMFAGFDFKVSRKKIILFKPENQNLKRKQINVRVMGSLASKQIINVWDKDFKIIATSLTVSRYYNNTNKILIGFDGIYDETIKYFFEEEGKPTDYWLDISKFGVNIGHEWTFAKLSIFMNLGYYVHNNNKNKAILYNKLGINYNFLKFAFVGLNLQTHWAKADFLSVGLGFNF